MRSPRYECWGVMVYFTALASNKPLGMLIGRLR
jgi:hypothetical protein